MFARSPLSRSHLHHRFLSLLARPSPNDVVIVSAVRTPVGMFNGGLAALSATQLGAAAVKAAVARGGIRPEDVAEVIMGNVESAGSGQAPARHAATVDLPLPPFVDVNAMIRGRLAAGARLEFPLAMH